MLKKNLMGAVMEWTDITRLNSLIKATEADGTKLEEIGVSGEGRPLYGITIGDSSAPYTVVIIAGCHANEIIGPLAAVSMLHRLTQQLFPTVKFGIVPVADPDSLSRNASELPSKPTLCDLLRLNHCRDLEGYFITDTYPECIAIRQWLQRFARIDAYFSLHSAGVISPGLFFYIGQGVNPSYIEPVANSIATVLPKDLPLLSHDPTGLSQVALSPGFFELSIANGNVGNRKSPGSSLAFVAQHFQPQFMGATELPLAVCPALKNGSLLAIEQYNREFQQTCLAQYPFREIDLTMQLSIMQAFIVSVAQCVTVIHT
ncbi:M14 family zinc carboxypeptidase [Leptothoe sp. ISB3NOV94-8A]